MSNEEQRLRNAIAQCAGRGFEHFTVNSSRGDSNCPHLVTYHPKDGHGFEDESKWCDFTEDGKSASFDEDLHYEDPLVVLAKVFESFSEIKDRELIKQGVP